MHGPSLLLISLCYKCDPFYNFISPGVSGGCWTQTLDPERMRSVFCPCATMAGCKNPYTIGPQVEAPCYVMGRSFGDGEVRLGQVNLFIA